MSMPKKYFTKEELQEAHKLREQRRREQKTLSQATELVREIRGIANLYPMRSAEQIAQEILENYRIIKK